MNHSVAVGVAFRQFTLKSGFGFADSVRFVHGKAVGVLEAKMAGTTLTGVEPQPANYANGLARRPAPAGHPAPFSVPEHWRRHEGLQPAGPEPRSRRTLPCARARVAWGEVDGSDPGRGEGERRADGRGRYEAVQLAREVARDAWTRARPALSEPAQGDHQAQAVAVPRPTARTSADGRRI